MVPQEILVIAQVSDEVRKALPLLFALGGVVFLGFGVLVVLRRSLRAEEGGAEGDPFTLEGLRELRRRGLLEEEEFERAKAGLLASMGQGRPLEAPRANPITGELRAAEGYDLTGEPLPGFGRCGGEGDGPGSEDGRDAGGPGGADEGDGGRGEGPDGAGRP